ncbi:MAG: hypothetical protein GVY23_06135 [Spirochaetes bacterium]|jgi:hypothetical protein|nr:hypothetical protein [Spirochaetota bacterium]
MQMEGMPRWVTIDRSNALETRRARKRAFPDFCFNDKIEREDGNSVTIAVSLTGTHTGYLDYPIDQVPELAATGKSINLPAEYFTYYIDDDQIHAVFGRIPEGHGTSGLQEQFLFSVRPAAEATECWSRTVSPILSVRIATSVPTKPMLLSRPEFLGGSDQVLVDLRLGLSLRTRPEDFDEMDRPPV